MTLANNGNSQLMNETQEGEKQVRDKRSFLVVRVYGAVTLNCCNQDTQICRYNLDVGQSTRPKNEMR